MEAIKADAVFQTAKLVDKISSEQPRKGGHEKSPNVKSPAAEQSWKSY